MERARRAAREKVARAAAAVEEEDARVLEGHEVVERVERAQAEVLAADPADQPGRVPRPVE